MPTAAHPSSPMMSVPTMAHWIRRFKNEGFVLVFLDVLVDFLPVFFAEFALFFEDLGDFADFVSLATF